MNLPETIGSSQILTWCAPGLLQWRCHVANAQTMFSTLPTKRRLRNVRQRSRYRIIGFNIRKEQIQIRVKCAIRKNLIYNKKYNLI